MSADYLSFSRLNTLAGCPAAYDLKYRQNVPREPQGAFVGGKTVHATIEKSEQESWWQVRDNFLENGVALEFYHSLLDEALAEAGPGIRFAGRKSRDFPNGEDGQWWHREGESMLRRYQTIRADTLGGLATEVASEVEVSMTLPSGKLIKGYIDAFLSSSTQGPAIIDYKTGKPGGGPWQLVTYAVMVEHSPLISEVGGEVVSRGALVYLRAKDAKQVVWYDLEPMKPLVIERYEQLARRLEAADFPFDPTAWHESCDVRFHCDYYKALLAAEGRELPGAN